MIIVVVGSLILQKTKSQNTENLYAAGSKNIYIKFKTMQNY